MGAHWYYSFLPSILWALNHTCEPEWKSRRQQLSLCHLWVRDPEISNDESRPVSYSIMPYIMLVDCLIWYIWFLYLIVNDCCFIRSSLGSIAMFIASCLLKIETFMVLNRCRTMYMRMLVGVLNWMSWRISFQQLALQARMCGLLLLSTLEIQPVS